MTIPKDELPLAITEAERWENVLQIDLWYPRVKDGNDPHPVDTLQIRLMDVRAADDIRVSYDFERDGWKIEQEEIVRQDGGFESTGKWIEVFFVKAWAQEMEAETA